MKTWARVAQPWPGWWSRIREICRMASPLTMLGACWLAGLRLNLTGSLPVGLYRIARAAPERGTIVLICLPLGVAGFAKARGYLAPHGSCPGDVPPLGKPVVAIPGDTVSVTAVGFLVNGAPVANSRALAVDRRGRRLPHLSLGQYVIGPGALWVASAHSPFSFDSRYFGSVDTNRVRACLRPLLTVGTDQ